MNTAEPTRSRYQESPDAREMFTRRELKHMRHLLRRLRFLERSIAERGGSEAASGGGVFAEIESEALIWVLTEVDFLAEPID